MATDLPGKADVLGTDEARIAKSILFLADGQPLMVVLCGNMTVDTNRLLEQLNCPAHAGVWSAKPALHTPISDLSLATRRQAEEITGYRVGTIGPFAHKQPIATVVDKRIAAFSHVFAGCGSADMEMRVETNILIRVAACGGEHDAHACPIPPWVD